MYLSYWLDISSGATIVLLEAAIFATVFAGEALLGRRSVFRPAATAERPLPLRVFDD
jgi:hypothetical protein